MVGREGFAIAPKSSRENPPIYIEGAHPRKLKPADSGTETDNEGVIFEPSAYLLSTLTRRSG
jgi:hypothetical protein